MVFMNRMDCGLLSTTFAAFPHILLKTHSLKLCIKIKKKKKEVLCVRVP